jgi:serine/threonine protein kinase
MPVLTCTSTDQPISLVKQIASSGEGEIWQTNLDGYLAKVYYSPDARRIGKLEVMIAHPPEDPNADMNHISFAWPKSLLRDAAGNGVGFLMPTIANSVQLLDVYNPQRRQKVLPGFSWLYLHTTAMNIASIIWAIHRAGYVLGDIKPENILVNNRALPAVIDTDSFQVRHPKTGELYRCPVGSEGFTPVELLGKDLGSVEQTEIHDRFRLGVIIHLLLFGDPPFKGKWVGEGDSPTPNDLLRQGFWSYAPNSLIQPGPLTIPLEIAHPAVKQCFLRCFNEGHTQPELRPSAGEWFMALRQARSELKLCKKAKTHVYSQSYGKCYWCDRKAKLGVDIFPAPMDPKKKAAKKLFQQLSAPVNSALKTWNPQQAATSFNLAKVKLVRRAKTMAQTGQVQVAVPKPIAPFTNLQTPPASAPATPSLASPSDQSKTLSRLGVVLGSVVAVFALLLFLSRSRVDTQEIELTVVGVFLCLGLVGIGFLWLRVLDKYNP